MLWVDCCAFLVRRVSEVGVLSTTLKRGLEGDAVQSSFQMGVMLSSTDDWFLKCLYEEGDARCNSRHRIVFATFTVI